MPLLDRGGVRIHYEASGDGPAILLTHGFAASSAMFGPNVAPLAAARHTVITWDLRGHGRSDYPTDPSAYSVPLAVDDMAALLDATEAEKAVIAGHSLGGFLSLEFHLAHPDRTEALVLIGTGPGYRKPEGREGWNRMAERYAARLEDKGLPGLGASEELDASAHRDATGLAMVARGILPQHDARVIDSLPGTRVPTLVVVGERDEQFMAGSRYLADRIPGASLVEVDGAGHAPNVSHAEQFNQVVVSFLAESGGGRS